MKSKLKVIFLISFCLITLWIINSCKKEEVVTETDKELYEMAKDTSGFVWYKSSDSLLDRSSGSEHPQPFLRTRYNSVAATKLDPNGKVMTGTEFPEGSLIVKELFENSTTIGRYAILYKNSGNEYADTKGWVWGYIDADGSVAESVSKKGKSCITCHSQDGNINFTLMNTYFP